MEILLLHISYLIEHHDCVVVPGVGAFIGRFHSARYCTESGKFYPPYREITFNGDITFDDGLLVSSFSRRDSVNYTKALDSVKNDVAMLNETLRSGTSVRIGNIGDLMLNEQGNYEFCPLSENLISLPVIDIAVASDTDSKVEGAPAMLPAPSRFSSLARGVVRYAAMVCLLLSLSLIFSTPIIDDRDCEVVKANLCPFDTEDISFEAIPDFLIAQPCVEELPACNEYEELNEDNTIVNQPYILVIASLANRELAEKFISEAGNDAIGVLEQNGRFRVYGQQGNTVAELLKSPLLEKYPDAWPCAISVN